MNKLDLLRMSLNSLRRRKTRTFLTVLGVVIGTVSIVIMLSLSTAMNENFKEQISHMGSLTIIDVSSGAGGEMPNNSQQSDSQLNDKAVDSFAKIPGVASVMGLKRAYMRIVSGKLIADAEIVGVDPSKLEAFDYKINAGRLLLVSDKDAIVFGKMIAYNFRNPKLNSNDMNGPDVNSPPPVNLISSKLLLTADAQYGERISNSDPNYKSPRPHEIRGIGILKESGDEKDYQGLMNITSLRKIIAEDNKSINQESHSQTAQDNQYDNIKVKVTSLEDVQAVQKQIQSQGYQASSLTDMLESMKKTSRTIQAILGGIGAVSLLVAAIGIANTMIMSIYERTREIGIIKVLGAEVADIKRLFLLEAGMIGLGGGILGIIFSYAGSLLLNKVGGSFMANMSGGSKISIIDPQLAIGALLFSTLIGLFSGYAPARRAMNLSALEAIRSE